MVEKIEKYTIFTHFSPINVKKIDLHRFYKMYNYNN